MEGTKKKSLLMIECELERLKSNIEELRRDMEEAKKISFAAENYKQGMITAKSGEQVFLGMLLNQILLEDLEKLVEKMEGEQ